MIGTSRHNSRSTNDGVRFLDIYNIAKKCSGKNNQHCIQEFGLSSMIHTVWKRESIREAQNGQCSKGMVISRDHRSSLPSIRNFPACERISERSSPASRNIILTPTRITKYIFHIHKTTTCLPKDPPVLVAPAAPSRPATSATPSTSFRAPRTGASLLLFPSLL